MTYNVFSWTLNPTQQPATVGLPIGWSLISATTLICRVSLEKPYPRVNSVGVYRAW